MFVGQNKKLIRKKRPSISDFNKYLINSLENKDTNDKINNSFIISSNNLLPNIKSFNNPNKKLLLEKLDTSNLNKNKNNKQKSFYRYNSINFDNSEDLFMAQKLSNSIMSERIYNSNIYYPKKISDGYKNKNKDINLFNSNTKERTSSTFDNDFMDIIEASPLKIYNRKMEYISFVIKIQSIWREYIALKKYKKYKLFLLLDKILYRNYIYYSKLFIKLLNEQLSTDIIYNQKNKENNIIKKNLKIHFIKPIHKKLKQEQKIKTIPIKDKIISKSSKKLRAINYWIKLPLILEKLIKNKILFLYSKPFFEKLKLKEKEILKEKQKKILYKLININEMKNLKNYMNIYKDKTLFKKPKPKVYYSLIKSKSRVNPKNKIFDFKTFYKKNILEEIIKKYRYTSIIQKYYLTWKKISKENKISNNKKKRVIKIKRVKKNYEKDLNILKEDNLNNVSEISNNISFTSNNTLNSLQSIKGMKICLTTTNKKMRIKRITVDTNYYKNIENNNHYNK